MIEFAVFGAGRIGTVHAVNLHQHPDARVRYVVDVDAGSAVDLAARCGARVVSATDALADRDVAAVVIATSTDTHTGLIGLAAAAGKAIFCEKPIDLDIERARAALDAVNRHGVRLAIGFNRRHDPSFREIKDQVAAGAVGSVEYVGITSRDPTPPPAEYIARSGGMFRDMTIHDFDMARWLLGEEPVVVFATGSVLFDRSIGEAGDVDSAVALLKTRSGKLCSISNSRRSSHGYDQRIEVFGSSGMLQAGNEVAPGVGTAASSGSDGDVVVPFFLQRYKDAYRIQIDRFLRRLKGESVDLADGVDGLKALILANCAQNSLTGGQPMAVDP
ncbi:MAG: inositol 2-dehydrogenase [Gammaproteobacteria bacterium]|nr:inositol 2-dehydrogenase [Gammaproteobacteria bacterium]MDE0366304.1 inositol 2-dehydrogenase [Gammaproteobacteria bacterium]